MTPARSRYVRRLGWLVGAAVGLALSSSPAAAFTGHVFSGPSFGAGAAGEFSNPLGVAVDNYAAVRPRVTSTSQTMANGRILKFSPAGTFISEISGLTGPQYVAVESHQR